MHTLPTLCLLLSALFVLFREDSSAVSVLSWCPTSTLSLRSIQTDIEVGKKDPPETKKSVEEQLWDLVNARNRRKSRFREASIPQESTLVPYQQNTCLARNPSELLQLCHFLSSLNLSSESVTTPKRAIFPSPLEQFVWKYAEEKKGTFRGEWRDQESKSALWKARFGSLEKVREQLKDPPAESESTHQIMESIESDDVGEWINFASSAAGAKIIGTNPEARNEGKLIDGKKDTFMKNDCKANQWLIVELSNVAAVRMIEITMKELYSPRVASLAVYGRMSSISKNPADYPDKFERPQWIFLGELHPENRKGTQHFPLHKRDWVKYLGFHIRKYHGMGTTCTINDVSIYGVAPVNNLETLLETAVQEDQSYDANLGEARSGVQSPKETRVESIQESLPTDESTTPSTEQCISTSFENVVLEDGTSTNGKPSTGRVLSISTFKRMHQDVQSLKGSTAVLSKYVDELHGSLIKTIDELWGSQEKTKSSTGQLNHHFLELQSSLHRIEQRMERLEDEQKKQSKRVRAWMSTLGFSISLIGVIAIRSSSYFSTKSLFFSLLIYFLCTLNLLVACLTLASLFRPTFLLKLHHLKRNLPFHWCNFFT